MKVFPAACGWWRFTCRSAEAAPVLSERVLAQAGHEDMTGEVTSNGCLPDCTPVPGDIRDLLAVATQIPASGHLAMVSAIQACVDEAVAKTVNLPAAATRVLLMRRAGTIYGGDRLAFPAGHVDLGETVTECAVREIQEELGVGLDPAELVSPISMFRRSLEPRVDFFFVATRWQGDPGIREPHKCTELLWAFPDDLPVDTLDFVGRALSSVRSGRVFDEFGWEPTAEANSR